MHVNRHDGHLPGGGGNPDWAAFELAFRSQVDAWLQYDDARRDGSTTDLAASRVVLDDAREVARAARERLGVC